jgi:hypothetical protein
MQVTPTQLRESRRRARAGKERTRMNRQQYGREPSPKQSPASPFQPETIKARSMYSSPVQKHPSLWPRARRIACFQDWPPVPD